MAEFFSKYDWIFSGIGAVFIFFVLERLWPVVTKRSKKVTTQSVETGANATTAQAGRDAHITHVHNPPAQPESQEVSLTSEAKDLLATIENDGHFLVLSTLSGTRVQYKPSGGEPMDFSNSSDPMIARTHIDALQILTQNDYLQKGNSKYELTPLGAAKRKELLAEQ